MSDLPAVSGKDAIKAFKKLGFNVARTSASHTIMKKEGHPMHLSIPVHGNKSLHMGLLKGQIALAGVTEAEFAAVL